MRLFHKFIWVALFSLLPSFLFASCNNKCENPAAGPIQNSPTDNSPSSDNLVPAPTPSDASNAVASTPKKKAAQGDELEDLFRKHMNPPVPRESVKEPQPGRFVLIEPGPVPAPTDHREKRGRFIHAE